MAIITIDSCDLGIVGFVEQLGALDFKPFTEDGLNDLWVETTSSKEEVVEHVIKVFRNCNKRIKVFYGDELILDNYYCRKCPARKRDDCCKYYDYGNDRAVYNHSDEI